MKLLSFLTLTALLSISACSHHHKGHDCCGKKEKVSCEKKDCKKACCDKDKKCADGSCAKDKKDKAHCSDNSCHKKS